MSKPVLLASRQPMMYIRARHPHPTAMLKQARPPNRNSLSSSKCQRPHWNQGICDSSSRCGTCPTEFTSLFVFFSIPFYRCSEFTCFPLPLLAPHLILLSHFSNTYLPSLPHRCWAQAEGGRKSSIWTIFSFSHHSDIGIGNTSLLFLMFWCWDFLFFFQAHNPLPAAV